MPTKPPNRRNVLTSLVGAGAASITGGAGLMMASPAEARLRRPPVVTPAQIEGPYYPSPRLRERLFPHDADNNLCQIPDQPAAEGRQVLIGGTVGDLAGQAVVGARVEIWQTCHRGRYLDPGDDYGSEIPVDPGFQYFGSCLSGEDGSYAFRTVMPRRYPSGGQREWWRPPHVHVKVWRENRDVLTTQLYFDDPLDPENGWKHRAVQEVDRLLGDVPAERRSELVCLLGPPDEIEGLAAALARHGLEAEPEGTTATRGGWFGIIVEG